MDDLKIKINIDNEEIDVVVHDIGEVKDDGTLTIDYTIDDSINLSMAEAAIGNFIINALEKSVSIFEQLDK